MRRYLKDTLTGDNGDLDIFIEVDQNEDDLDLEEETSDLGPTRSRLGRSTARAFQKGMALIRASAKEVADTMNRISDVARPNELEVKFAVKFDAHVGALITTSGIESHLQVKLKWQRKECS